jgi:hypothetical protein
MASAKQDQGSAAASVDDGLVKIGQAITATMYAPDAANPQVHQALMQMQQMTLGIKQMASGKGPQGGPQQQPGGTPPGAMAGGGTNLRQMMGGAPSAPSGGMGGGPTSTGMSADDMAGAAS